MGDLTHIQTTHERNFAVNDAQLLVVGPVQDHVARRTIQGLEGAARGLGEAESGQAGLQIGKFSL